MNTADAYVGSNEARVMTLREEQVHLTKTRILNVFESELQSKGYDKVSIRSLAKLAGMSVSTVCRYYPDKEAILSALITSRQSEGGFDPQAILASTREPVKALTKILDTMWDYGGQRTSRVKTLVEALAVAGGVAEASVEIHRNLASLAAGALSGIPVASAAEAKRLHSTVAMLMGPQTWYTLRFGHGLSREEARSATEDALHAVINSALRTPAPDRTPRKPHIRTRKQVSSVDLGELLQGAPVP
jgi:AcrR family transcriptional regulator